MTRVTQLAETFRPAMETFIHMGRAWEDGIAGPESKRALSA